MASNQFFHVWLGFKTKEVWYYFDKWKSENLGFKKGMLFRFSKV